MHRIIIAIGSNHDAMRHIAKAEQLLREVLSDVDFTRTIQTMAIGDRSLSPFYHNALATAMTSLSMEEVISLLKGMERECGDDASLRECGVVNVDLDLLQYADTKLHDADWQRDYIQLLMGELQNIRNE